jgi:excisionase family DNA binding protein
VNYLSLDEAAKALNVSRRRAQALVETGQLPGHRIGGRWLIEAADVHQRRRVAAPRGRPLQAASAWRVLAETSFPAEEGEQDAFR